MKSLFAKLGGASWLGAVVLVESFFLLGSFLGVFFGCYPILRLWNVNYFFSGGFLLLLILKIIQYAISANEKISKKVLSIDLFISCIFSTYLQLAAAASCMDNMEIFISHIFTFLMPLFLTLPLYLAFRYFIKRKDGNTNE